MAHLTLAILSYPGHSSWWDNNMGHIIESTSGGLRLCSEGGLSLQWSSPHRCFCCIFTSESFKTAPLCAGGSLGSVLFAKPGCLKKFIPLFSLAKEFPKPALVWQLEEGGCTVFQDLTEEEKSVGKLLRHSTAGASTQEQLLPRPCWVRGTRRGLWGAGPSEYLEFLPCGATWQFHFLTLSSSPVLRPQHLG